MADFIEKQPPLCIYQPLVDGEIALKVRKMRKNTSDCRFVANLSVDAFQDEFIHATSIASLPKVKECNNKVNSIQDPWFYDRVFIAEYEGQLAGLLNIKYHGDPEPRSGNSYDSLSCCDKRGLWCMAYCNEESVPAGKAYVDEICVVEEFRGKGIGTVLLRKAEDEATAKGCTKIYLYTSWTNRAKNLYDRLGYNVVDSGCLCGFLWCAMGMRGAYKMEKNLE